MAAEDLLSQAVDLQFLVRLAVALAVGALIGLERERHREGRTVLAGIRTYPLASMGGVLLAQVADALDAPAVLVAGAAVYGASALLLYHVRSQLGLHGLTSPMAFFVTYVVGMLIGLGLILEGVVAGVATAVLLFTKAHLHRLAEVMSEDEMAGALQFIILAFILFPLTAAGPVDPWGIFYPRRFLLVVIFVASISFASFLVMRSLGANRGLAVSGLLGGLVNSEATTGSLAAMARERRGLQAVVVSAVALANATMLLRNLLVAAFVDPTLRVLGYMSGPVLLMLVVQAALARAPLGGPAKLEKDADAVRLGNPFAIRPALKFAVVFLALQLATAGIRHVLPGGELGILVIALGGLVSSAAVVASVGSLAFAGLVSPQTAAITGVLSVLVSTLNKLLLVRAVDPSLVGAMRARFVPPAVAGAGALVLLIVWI